MFRKSGHTFKAVANALRGRGLDPSGLELARLGGGEYIVMIHRELIGRYYSRTGQLVLYTDALKTE